MDYVLKMMNFSFKWRKRSADHLHIVDISVYQRANSNTNDVSIQNAEWMENCPWKTKFLHSKMATCFAIRGEAQNCLSAIKNGWLNEGNGGWVCVTFWSSLTSSRPRIASAWACVSRMASTVLMLWAGNTLQAAVYIVLPASIMMFLPPTVLVVHAVWQRFPLGL